MLPPLRVAAKNTHRGQSRGRGTRTWRGCRLRGWGREAKCKVQGRWSRGRRGREGHRPWALEGNGEALRGKVGGERPPHTHTQETRAPIKLGWHLGHAEVCAFQGLN